MDKDDMGSLRVLLTTIEAQACGATALCEWGPSSELSEDIRSDLHSMLGYSRKALARIGAELVQSDPKEGA